MNGDEKRSAFFLSYKQQRSEWSKSTTANLNINSMSSSMASCETSSTATTTTIEKMQRDPSNTDMSLSSEGKSLNQQLTVKKVAEPDNLSLGSSSPILTSSFASSGKLSYAHDNGPSSDLTTPENHATTKFQLSPRLNKGLGVPKSSDEDDHPIENNTRLLRHRRKVSPRRTHDKTTHVSQSMKSSSYPSSVTSGSAHLSSSDASLKCRQASTPSRCKKICMHHKRNLAERTVTWKCGRSGDSRRGRRERNRSCCALGSCHYSSVIPEEHRLVINVSGKKCEVDSRVLNCHPCTLLGDPERRSQFYDRERKEVFLDRHRGTFDAVLDFYEKGILRRPCDIPIDLFNEEVRFYSFDYCTLKDYLTEEDILYVEKVVERPEGKVRQFIWSVFEGTDNSICSKLVTILSAIVIAISVIVFCLETLPSFHSLSHNVTESIEPALRSCHQTLTTTQNVMRESNRYDKTKPNVARSTNAPALTEVADALDSRVPVLSLYNFTDLMPTLQRTAHSCKQSNRLKLLYRYTIARCWLQLFDSSANVEDMLRDFNVTPSLPALQTADETTSTRRRVRHLPSDSTSINASVARAGSSGTRTLVFEVLLHLCPILNVKSRRSQYAWFLLEATVGSPAGILFITETSCIVWFVTELGLRFFSCPNKKTFFKRFLNVIDLLAILPYFITLLVTSIETKTQLRPQTATILRTIRLVRMLRILKLSRYSRGFRILGMTLLRSTRVLFLLVGFQVVLAVLFSSIAYFVEYGDPNTQFKSIPESFWWALITMTTVGYGDIAPVTILGKITGACCAILGILSISFPVPVIVSNFNYLYKNDKDTGKLQPEDLMPCCSNQLQCAEESLDKTEATEKRLGEVSNEEVRKHVTKVSEKQSKMTQSGLDGDLCKAVQVTEEIGTTNTLSFKESKAVRCGGRVADQRSVMSTAV